MPDGSIDQIKALMQQASYYGVRRLLTMSGRQSWCYDKALSVVSSCSDDWHWVSGQGQPTIQTIDPAKAHLYLGRELKHLVFDATEGFDADALAALSGTQVAGSFLVLLIPPWSQWETFPDRDSLRWSEQPEPIATPHFVHHVKRCWLHDPTHLLWREGEAILGTDLSFRQPWHMPDGSPTAQQRELLQQLLQANPGYYILTADRGRGKSALAGMLMAKWHGEGECWVTGPSRASADKVIEWSGGKAQFIAPDRLLELCQISLPNVDWLIVDEAAAIPSFLLYQLVSYFPRILFTTTVLGYEGTGRGFLLKFCSGLPLHERLILSSPIRWAENDPLENVVNQMLLLNAELDAEEGSSELSGKVIGVKSLSQSVLDGSLKLLRQFYGLLTSAHYRTTPLDLRRLLDAPGHSFLSATDKYDNIVGALWSVQEGGLSKALAHDVWLGRRRPKGNLVAQSLSAHAGLYHAPQLRSLRISRIAVQSAYRRSYIGQRLILTQIEQAKTSGFDYLSVSFGYTDELWLFWRACGFSLIHLGSQKEASSGCYAAMAILPLSEAGEDLLDEAQERFQRNQQQRLVVMSALWRDKPVLQYVFDEADWFELVGFAFGLRTLESARFSLQRLNESWPDSISPALALYIKQGDSPQTLAHLKLSGRKALIDCLRIETGNILSQINFTKTSQLQHWVSDSPKADLSYRKNI